MTRSQLCQSGQSLLEIVVVVGIVVLLTTGLLAASTVALRGSQYGTAKTDAVKLASEGLELVRNDRDKSWTTFNNRNNRTYKLCGNGTFQLNPACPISLAGREYTRLVMFVWNVDRMEVTVTVTWIEGGTIQTSVLKSYFTQWK